MGLPELSSYKVLYSFQGPYEVDGSYPVTRLTELNGVLYGTTSRGGVDDRGTFFRLSTSGKEHVLHSFGANHDGSSPSGLIAVGNVFYGVAGGGPGYKCDCGTVFRIDAAGNERIIYRFKGGSDGNDPSADLVQLGGQLYGVTYGGGAACNCGTVFAISPSGKERVIYSFQGGNDGANPQAALFAHNGVLYGSTERGGGSKSCFAGCGTVFEVSTSGKERVSYRFTGYPDGALPLSSLVFSNGVFYGTTRTGGAAKKGTIFAVTPAGNERVLYSFKTQGDTPRSGLTLASGALYGTASLGGTPGFGTVFTISSTGQERTLHAFRGYPDGGEPYGPLFFHNGALYGTTYMGGRFDRGAVFEVKP